MKPDARAYLLVGLAGVVAALVFAPMIVSAQATPRASSDAIVLSPAHMLDFGEQNHVQTDCVYFEMQGTSGASAVAPTTDDFRITPCVSGTKPALSPVTNGDTAENGYATGTGNTAPTVKLRFGDANGNGVYDSGTDVLYLSTYDGSNLFGTASTTNWTVRLQATHGFAAGTYVFPADLDRQAFASNSRVTAGSLAWNNTDSATAFTGASKLFILPTNSSLAKGAVMPANRFQLYPSTSTTTTSTTTTTSNTTTTTSNTTTTTTSTTSTTTSNTSTTPTTTKLTVTPKPTPGPGSMSLAAGVAVAVSMAALVVARRRG